MQPKKRLIQEWNDDPNNTKNATASNSTNAPETTINSNIRTSSTPKKYEQQNLPLGLLAQPSSSNNNALNYDLNSAIASGISRPTPQRYEKQSLPFWWLAQPPSGNKVLNHEVNSTFKPLSKPPAQQKDTLLLRLLRKYIEIKAEHPSNPQIFMGPALNQVLEDSRRRSSDYRDPAIQQLINILSSRECINAVKASIITAEASPRRGRAAANPSASPSQIEKIMLTNAKQERYDVDHNAKYAYVLSWIENVNNIKPPKPSLTLEF